MLNPIDYSISKFVTFTDTETLNNVRKIASTKHFKKGTNIEWRGEPSEHVYLIEKGLVQLGINSADGSRFNLTRMGPGHTFGETAFFLRQKVAYDAYAQTDVTLQKLTRENVDELITQSLIFAKAIISVASIRLQTTLSHIGDTLGMTLEARVAKQILSVSQSIGNKTTINLRQVDLAHSLGVSRVSIGKALKTLAEKNLIKIGYGKLDILSSQELAEVVRVNEPSL